MWILWMTSSHLLSKQKARKQPRPGQRQSLVQRLKQRKKQRRRKLRKRNQMAKILLAEDDKTMVSLLKTLLKMEGFEVVALDIHSDVPAAVQREMPQAL